MSRHCKSWHRFGERTFLNYLVRTFWQAFVRSFWQAVWSGGLHLEVAPRLGCGSLHGAVHQTFGGSAPLGLRKPPEHLTEHGYICNHVGWKLPQPRRGTASKNLMNCTVEASAAKAGRYLQVQSTRPNSLPGTCDEGLPNNSDQIVHGWLSPNRCHLRSDIGIE